MDNNLNQYNQAISLIKQNKWEEAEKILLQLAKYHPNHSHTLYTLGLLEAATGRPFAALTHWSSVSTHEIPVVKEKLETLRMSLPFYQHIFNAYNDALMKAKTRDFTAVLTQMKEILEEAKSLTLPVEIYRAYFLALLINKNEKDFWEAFNSAPSYVKNNLEIKGIQLKLANTEMKAMQDQNKKKITNNKRWTRSAVSVAVVCLIVLAGFVLEEFKTKEQIAQPAQSVVENSNIAVNKNSSGKIEKVAQQVESLLKENSELRTTNENVLKELEQSEYLKNLLQDANIPLKELEASSALILYKAGLADYQNGDYVNAEEKLGKSMHYLADSYFSDDAHYFYIKSLISLEKSAEAHVSMEEFIVGETSVYKDSPYIDDIMIELAKYYLATDKKEKAVKLLTTIRQQYASEWTVHEAQRLLEEL